MKFVFKYKQRTYNNPNNIHVPEIPIILKKGEKSFLTMALVDSGADVSVISQEIAEYLDLPMDGKRIKVSGITGKLESVDGKIPILITGRHDEKDEFEIPVKILLDNPDHDTFPMLLGRQTFFTRYVITFHDKERRLTLKPAGN